MVSEISAGANGKAVEIPAEARDFVSALFAPKDIILFRFIETWVEAGVRKSRNIYPERYATAGHFLGGPWEWRTHAGIAQREMAHQFMGVCPREGVGSWGVGHYNFACQIRTVRALYSDVDGCRPQEVLEKCRDVDLPSPSILVATGNGAHVYWLLDEPYIIADAFPLPIKKVNRGTTDKPQWFDVYVDPATGTHKMPPGVGPMGMKIQSLMQGIRVAIGGDKTTDLARILRLPGTLNRKDQRGGKEPVPCRLVDCRPERAYSLDEFEKFAPKVPAKKSPSLTGGYTAGETEALDVRAWIESHGNEVVKEKVWNGDNMWIMRECPFDANHHDKSAFIIQYPDGGVAFRCLHNSCAEKKWRDVQKLYGESPRYIEAGCVYTEEEFDRLFTELVGDKPDSPPEPAVVPRTEAVDDDDEADVFAGGGEEYDDPRPEDEAPDKPKYTFDPISSADFAKAEFTQEWLIKNIMTKGQPAIIGGPKKAMKTSFLIDMCLSLGSGTRFLGKWPVARKTRCVLISGESGEATIQETALRICAAKHLDLAKVDCYWDFRLPQLAQEDELGEVGRGLRDRKIAVAIIDPLYLSLLSGEGAQGKSASNVFDMGPLLYRVAEACLSVGCTPVLAHHARKNILGYDPLDLEDLAFAGIQEFARQWLLLSRREKFVAGTGEHKLWFTVGGSAGHSGLWPIDVNEGTLADDFTGRSWEVEVMSLDDVKESKKEAQEAKRAEQDEELAGRFLAALDAWRSGLPCTKTGLCNKLGWSRGKFGRIYVRLFEKQVIELVTTTIQGPNKAMLKAEVIRRK